MGKARNMESDSRAGDQEMTVRIAVSVTSVAVFTVSLLALILEYPCSTYAAFDFPQWMTFISYVVVAALTTAPAATTAAVFLWAPAASATFRSVACGVASFGLMALLGLLLGPAGLDIPGTRVRGMFFAEWKFLNFIFLVAAPSALVAAVVCAWSANRRSQFLQH